MALIWLLLFAGTAFGASLLLRPTTLPSAPTAYGSYAATATLCSGCVLLGGASLLTWLPTVVAYTATALVAVAATLHSRRLQRKQQRARAGFEHLVLWLLASAAALAIIATAGIIITLTVEAIYFFQQIPLTDFLFGTTWSPQIAIREDQAAAQGSFGFIPLLSGTMLITTIAMVVAVPSGIIVAVYLSEFASPGLRANIKPMLEVLAGVPTVVYGFFAIVVLSPILRDLGGSIGVQVAGESALAAGLVMSLMLLPFVISLSEDALFSVPDSLRQGALALGATRYEAAFDIIIPAALPGVAAGVLLAFSRAIGETMIVVMAAGVSASMNINPLEAVTTITVQIVTLLTGDQTFDDPKTLAAFALGLSLFIITLLINSLALYFVRHYQQRYD